MVSRAIKVCLLALLASHILWSYLSPESTTLRDLYLYNSIWLIATAIVIAAPLIHDRVAIAAIALAIFLWGLGSLAASLDQLSPSINHLSPLPQVLYSLFYPLLLLAIPRISSSRSRLRPIELLDSLIFGLGFTSICATILISVIPTDALAASDDFFLIFYPVGDLALLLIAAINLLMKGLNRQSFLLFTGVLSFALTDLYYLWLALNNRYSFGGIADSGWLIAISLIALATTSPPHQPKSSISPIHPALIALSIFISPIMLAISALRPNLFPIYILIPSIANLLFAFIRMSTALREARILADERVLARTDELTGLANRRRLLAELSQFNEVKGALLLLDLDGFKPINDRYGHEVGDRILQKVADRFTRTLPAGSLIARLGGDEFGVLLHGNFDECLEYAYALRASLSYPFTIAGDSLSVGVSIGVVYNDGKGELLKRADHAMYRAKHQELGVVHS